MTLSVGKLSFTAGEAAEWGATYGPWVIAGDWWRLWTANYIHFRIDHILLNMAALIVLGVPVSERMGAVRFSAFYTACGILGAAASVLANPQNVSAGASGAISGLLGALVAFRFLGDRSILGRGLVLAILCNILISIFITSIDWQCHLGGFVAGIVLGFATAATLKSVEYSKFGNA